MTDTEIVDWMDDITDGITYWGNVPVYFQGHCVRDDINNLALDLENMNQ